MLADIGSSLKSIAASVAGKCSCSVSPLDSLETLFETYAQKVEFAEIVTETYGVTISVENLSNFRDLNKLQKYILEQLAI